VSPELLGMIKEAVKLHLSSNGLFNPAAGELTALWEYHCDKADCTESPYPDEVRYLVAEKASALISQRPSMDDLVLDGNKVSSRNRSVKLEFGDLIRGFALERGTALLKEMGVENSKIFIGSGVATAGTRGGDPWWIGLPLLPGGEQIAGTIESTGNEAVVTVHAFERSIGRNDAVYRHVVDTRTGHPVKETRSVTVIHASATVANAAAAALLINGRDGWDSVAGKMGVQSVMMIARDGTIYTTPEMQHRIHWTQDVVHQSLVP
jgi:thiamine biosynthesis lipoprotein